MNYYLSILLLSVRACIIMSLTFSKYKWDSILSIQDPVFESYLDIGSFFDIYLSLLETLDGSDADSFVDLFFSRSPVNLSILIFIDEDARSDFADSAIEMKLIPDITETCQGESREDKLRRDLKLKPSKPVLTSSAKKKQSDQRLKLTFEEQTAKKIVGMQKEIARCRQLLEAETDMHEREKLNNKIHILISKSESTDVTI